MRVIAGKKRGTKLIAPKDKLIRPTTDRVKEAVFGTLQSYIKDANVLDLFCGSGALGIEAWSRGAKYIVLADKSLSSLELAKKNAAVVGQPSELCFLKKNYIDCIKMFKNTEEFDIVFIDPPYKCGLYHNAVNEIIKNRILSKDGVIVVESDAQIDFENNMMFLWKQKKYGSTIIYFLKQTAN